MRARRTDAASQRRRQAGKKPSFTQEQSDISEHYAWEGASPNDLCTAWAGKVSPHISVMVQLQFLTGNATVTRGKNPKSGKLLSSGVQENTSFPKMRPVCSHKSRTIWGGREKGLETALNNIISTLLSSKSWSCEPCSPPLNPEMGGLCCSRERPRR